MLDRRAERSSGLHQIRSSAERSHQDRGRRRSSRFPASLPAAAYGPDPSLIGERSPRRLVHVGLLRRQARRDAAAARSAHARAARHEHRQGRARQHLLEELPRRSGGGAGGRRRRDLRRAARALLPRRAAARHRQPRRRRACSRAPSRARTRAASTFTADQYNQVWQVWGGYAERPANFDELAAERYGSAFGPEPQPVPAARRGPQPDERRLGAAAGAVHAAARRPVRRAGAARSP